MNSRSSRQAELSAEPNQEADATRLGRQQILDKYWLEFLEWSHTMAINQVGRGQFKRPKNDLFVDPTDFEFWIWFTEQKIRRRAA